MNKEISMANEQMPPEIAAAIITVAKGLNPLAKTERNKYGGYDYVSVDTYYAAVRDLMADAGLIILCDEVGIESIDVQDTKVPDKTNTLLRVTFEFTLAHSSGAVWSRRQRRTGIVLASMGGQAIGAAQSYAEKIFLRSLWKMVTGEKDDIDAQPPVDLPRADKAKEHAAAFANDMKKQIAEARTIEAIDALVLNNAELLNRLQTGYPELFTAVENEWWGRVNALAATEMQAAE